MPIPAAPTCTPRSVSACDECCRLGNPAAIPPFGQGFILPDLDTTIDSFISDPFVIAGPGGSPDPFITPVDDYIGGGIVDGPGDPSGPGISTTPVVPVGGTGGGGIIVIQ